MKEDTVSTVQEYHKKLKQAFNTKKTRDLKWRKQQLSQLALGLEEMLPELNEATRKDLGRDDFSTYFLEVSTVVTQANHDKDMLDKWSKPSIRPTPMVLAPGKSKVVYQPLGVTCVMGAWNFPFTTIFLPLVSVIAAGNCALIKPSEMSPNCSAASRKLIETYLDNECFKVVEGGAEISIACSQQKWDKICFTGSSQKGKLVAQAAAKNLVPCLLELGGKCITIVDETADARIAAIKVIGGRLINSGQVCICPDYVYVHDSKKEEFTKAALEAAKDMYGEDAKASKFYSRMINEFHTKRVLDLIQNSGGKILCGGNGDVKEKYIEPTIIETPKADSKLMCEEIFGPVLPIVTFKDVNEVVEHLQDSEKPLAMYYFGKIMNNPNKEMFENEIQAGQMCVNDVMVQGINPDLPFGGVGHSGQGAYCGEDGFKNFSNSKAVLVKPTLSLDGPNKLVLPPYTEGEKKILRTMLKVQLTQDKVVTYFVAGLVLLLSLLWYIYFY